MEEMPELPAEERVEESRDNATHRDRDPCVSAQARTSRSLVGRSRTGSRHDSKVREPGVYYPISLFPQRKDLLDRCGNLEWGVPVQQHSAGRGVFLVVRRLLPEHAGDAGSERLGGRCANDRRRGRRKHPGAPDVETESCQLCGVGLGDARIWPALPSGVSRWRRPHEESPFPEEASPHRACKETSVGPARIKARSFSSISLHNPSSRRR